MALSFTEKNDKLIIAAVTERLDLKEEKNGQQNHLDTIRRVDLDIGGHLRRPGIQFSGLVPPEKNK